MPSRLWATPPSWSAALCSSGAAVTYEVTAMPPTTRTGPSVSAAQYSSRREPQLRGWCTRQIRFSRSSMLIIIASALNSITRMLMPVSLLAFAANPSMVACTASPVDGTKLLNTKLISVSRAGWNTGNAENIANTATVSGTSETRVVYDSAPAVSKHLSSTKRCQMKRLKLFVRSRLKRRIIAFLSLVARADHQHRGYRPVH